MALVSEILVMGLSDATYNGYVAPETTKEFAVMLRDFTEGRSYAVAVTRGSRVELRFRPLKEG